MELGAGALGDVELGSSTDSGGAPPPPPTKVPFRVRTIIPKALIAAGIVISIHAPKSVVAVPSRVPRSAKIVTVRQLPQSSVIKIGPARTDLPRWELGKVRVIPSSYQRNGYSFKIVPARNNLPRAKPPISHVLLTNYQRNGIVSRQRLPLPTPTVTVRVPRNKFLGTNYWRNGFVVVERHTHRVVVPVTTVRPKRIVVVPDYSIRKIAGILVRKRALRPIPQPGNVLLVCVDTAETWSQHFSNHAWNTVQDQINVGYPYYPEPSKTTAQYQEIFDFGIIYNNVIVSLDWTVLSIQGTVSIGSTIETSIDGSNWTAPSFGSTLFSNQLRYARATVNFSAPNDKSLSLFFNFKCALNVKREQDGGNAACLAADATGTVINLNKAFRALDAVTATPIGTTELKAVVNYDYATINPANFKVLVFNSAGARVDATVSWAARGIV